MASRVVVTSIDTAYGARLVGYILVSARRVFFARRHVAVPDLLNEAASCLNMAGSAERSLRFHFC